MSASFSLGRGLNNDYIMSSYLYQHKIGREYFITPNKIPRIWNSSKKYRIASVNLCINSMCKAGLTLHDFTYDCLRCAIVR